MNCFDFKCHQKNKFDSVNQKYYFTEKLDEFSEILPNNPTNFP